MANQVAGEEITDRGGLAAQESEWPCLPEMSSIMQKGKNYSNSFMQYKIPASGMQAITGWKAPEKQLPPGNPTFDRFERNR